jgi:predicted GNAT family acetyltransferase
MLKTAPVRVLDDRDLPAVRELLDRDPVANTFIRSRIDVAGVDVWRLGAELWGFHHGRELTALCYSGANLVPAEADPEALHGFAERARRQGRRCSSLVGPAHMVAPLWEELAPLWGAAREVRPRQPLLCLSGPPACAPDPRVRRVLPEEIGLLLPACVAMFTEEVGVSPVAGDGGAVYRARVAELIDAGRAFARIEDDGTVLFKAEVGAVTERACQVQGVWVHPNWRGRGLAAPGMAAVGGAALADLAPRVGLYVNDFNLPARRAYARAGFVEVGCFMSVLF